MKKLELGLALVMFTLLSYAQIPSGYYNDANSLSGDDLKLALHDIIKDHVEFPYTSTGTDVWDILKETDKDPNNSNNVILLYTGWSVDAEQEYNSGSGWTREHVWSKSHGDFGTEPGAGTDVHHLRPADVSVNSAKNSRWFDNGDTPYLDDGGTVPTGCNKGSSEWTWEPRDEEKGDVARMIFYMAVRYEGGNGEPDLEIIDFFPEDNYTNNPVYAKLSTLLQWNELDPVNDWERNRNNIIYEDYQHNRNPFIDHPEYAEEIWGTPSANSDNSGIVNVNFTGCNISGWQSISLAGDKDWECDNNAYKINAYYGNEACNDWFISSVINLDNFNNEILTFKTYHQYEDDGIEGAEVKLKYSTDYSGMGSPEDANWNEIVYSYQTTGTPEFTTSGDIDLSTIEGESIYFAFHYTSTGTGAGSSSLWKIDDILITGDEIITNIENENISEFKIYPNPAKDFIFIETQDFINKSIEIIDITGKIIVKETIENSLSKINIHHLDNGVYFVKSNNIIQKVIVQK